MELKVINKSNNPLPKYETEGAAGMDLMANLPIYSKEEDYRDIDCFKAKTKGKDVGFIIRQIPNADKHEMVLIIAPQGRAIIPTGLYIEVPKGYKADVKSRSGLAIKAGVCVLNADGLIDEDYRGEVGVILVNHNDTEFVIKNGDKIAQLVITKYERVDIIAVAELSNTNRGEGGYGSTNK